MLFRHFHKWSKICLQKDHLGFFFLIKVYWCFISWCALCRLYSIIQLINISEKTLYPKRRKPLIFAWFPGLAMCTIQRLLLPGGEWGNHQSQVQAALTPEICTLCHHQTSQDSPGTRWGGLYFIFFFIIFTTGLLPVATLELFFPPSRLFPF